MGLKLSPHLLKLKMCCLTQSEYLGPAEDDATVCPSGAEKRGCPDLMLIRVLRSNNFAFLLLSLTAAALGLICIKAPNLKENRQAEA